MARIEGLYAALRVTGPGARRNRLMTELEDAARRLAVVTGAAAKGRRAPVPHSRRGRRRALAARGAAWIIARADRGAASTDPAARGHAGPGHGPSAR
ncbi:hypothetical protein [Streptomyces colonosanans]|uniref:Uncharacterized protein n=1 Tax=Streptomyces colonosanans TaxID=1428652 RepID=A0A1S2NZ90_9ACTN|nr:hypothetical protein [Streptomyces colonosanans]OIJ86800.1 hypothetical protein BIV24_25615 [Streptomyces colonosanans]